MAKLFVCFFICLGLMFFSLFICMKAELKYECEKSDGIHVFTFAVILLSFLSTLSGFTGCAIFAIELFTEFLK